jgi:hypothetical protein
MNSVCLRSDNSVMWHIANARERSTARAGISTYFRIVTKMTRPYSDCL